MKIICIRKNFCSHRKKNLLFLPSNMAAVQNLYIMKDMTQAAGISGKTNHSGRKTLVQKLQDSGVSPNQIIQITEHKNVQSVKGARSRNFSIEQVVIELTEITK